ncbi:MAG: DUF4428 domain-containing protein [Firmicutes bacterium]|nr:DUF4428 domain-containing protein [Bacillota bacterium]
MLGNRKLDDGNLCKNCARKLSPWFNDRRHSTVAEIKEQLAYREANKEEVAAFHATRTLGMNTKIMLDEDAQRFMVTSARNIEEANPDVIGFSQVTGCNLDIDETRTELKRELPDGKEVSYIPPRFEVEYDFDIIINVDSPWFDEIKFRLNNSWVNANSRGEYDNYRTMGEEIKAVLTQVRQDVRDAAAAASAPKMAVTCPYCGATTMPDANGRCEYCGGAING